MSNFTLCRVFWSTTLKRIVASNSSPGFFSRNSWSASESQDGGGAYAIVSESKVASSRYSLPAGPAALATAHLLGRQDDNATSAEVERMGQEWKMVGVKLRPTTLQVQE